MKSMKKLVLAALILLASVVVLAGCKNDSVPEVPEVPEVPKYTVMFDTDGGSEVDSQSVESGKMATKPTDPTLEGSWFLGWYGDKEGTKEFDFSIPITDNTKVYAKWSYKLHSIPQILTDYSSPNNTDSEWTYVAFGDWPQTIKADDVEVTEDESTKKEMGMFTYYLGSDGNYYVKVTANPYEDGYTYSDESDVTEGSEVYFKVEPIVWRVLTEDYKVPGEGGELQSTHNALLLAENILTGGIPYYVDVNTRTITGAGTKDGEQDTVYPNNYKYSTIRAWLNGKYEDDDPQEKSYTNTGFLQTAFTTEAQGLIKRTTVDNSARSTNPESNGEHLNSGKNEYACKNTSDEIFLLSEQEATKSDYGFAEYNACGQGNRRIRVTTDYAKATGAYQSLEDGSGGWWWLRSPYYHDVGIARSIWYDGYAFISYNVVNYVKVGIVPALSISINGN